MSADAGTNRRPACSPPLTEGRQAGTQVRGTLPPKWLHS
jgi:hypothetical protein